MKLHMHPASATCRSVMLLIALGDLPVEQVLVDLMKGEQQGPTFSRLNPVRLVPVLEEGNFVLTESSAILKYMADRFESPLYPRDLQQRARVNERMDWFNTELSRDFGYNMVYPQVFPHHARVTPDHNAATIEWGRTRAASSLSVLDEHLVGPRAYLCGDAMTIADLFGAQLLSVGEWVRADLSRYPNVRRWFDTMRALPAWKTVNATHEGFAASMADRAFVAL